MLFVYYLYYMYHKYDNKHIYTYGLPKLVKKLVICHSSHSMSSFICIGKHSDFNLSDTSTNIMPSIRDIANLSLKPIQFLDIANMSLKYIQF